MKPLMLRITIEQNADNTLLILEGRIVGPWAAELGQAWTKLAPALGDRKLTIDLCETTYADAMGIQVLTEIYQQTTAEFVTSTPWTQYLAQQVRRESAIQIREEQ